MADGAGKSDHRAGAETSAGDGGGSQARVRDSLALLLTHWAGMRVCEVAALTRDIAPGPAGEILAEWRLGSDQTKGAMGRVVYANSKLRKDVAAYLKANPTPDRSYPVLVSQKGNGKRWSFVPNKLCWLINCLYREAGIAGAISHSGRRGYITTLTNHSVGIKTITELTEQRQLSTTQRYIWITPQQKLCAVDLVS